MGLGQYAATPGVLAMMVLGDRSCGRAGRPTNGWGNHAPLPRTPGPARRFCPTRRARVTGVRPRGHERPASTRGAAVASRVSAMKARDIILVHGGYQATLDAMPAIFGTTVSKALGPGRIVPSWDNPVYTAWREPVGDPGAVLSTAGKR